VRQVVCCSSAGRLSLIESIGFPTNPSSPRQPESTTRLPGTPPHEQRVRHYAASCRQARGELCRPPRCIDTSCPTTSTAPPVLRRPRWFDIPICCANFAIATPAVKSSCSPQSQRRHDRLQRQGLGANDNDTRRVFRRLDSLWAHPGASRCCALPPYCLCFVFGVSSRRLVSRRRRGTTNVCP